MQTRHVVVVAALVAAAGGVGYLMVLAFEGPERSDDDVPDAQRTDAPPPRVVEHPRPATRSPATVELPAPVATAQRRRGPEAPEDAAAQRTAAVLRRERAFLAGKGGGGTIAMLRALADARTHLFELVGSAERFGALFERRAGGPSIDGRNLDEKRPIADGTTITFPAGLCSWSVRRLGRSRDNSFPKDLLVVGAGMDATILRLDEFSSNDAIENLTFRDLTIDCGDDYMFDLRGDVPVSLRLERCRVFGFDMGGGGSVMLSADTAAFFASDSRFEAGYSRAGDRGFGNLFRVRSGLLARMERCTFVGPFSSVYDEDADATYDFVQCRFENCRTKGFEIAACLAAPPDGVRFENCAVGDVDLAAAAAMRVEFLTKFAAQSGGTTDLTALLTKYHFTAAQIAAARK